MVAASTVHPENETFLDWLLSEVAGGRAEVELNREMDADTIAALAPDAVIVATGGRLVTPRIQGDRLPHVVSGRALRELMSGRSSEETDHLPGWIRVGARLLAPFQAHLSPSRIRRLSRIALPVGRRVAVIGADLAALELAEFLANAGRSVSIFDEGKRFAPEVGGKRRTEHADRLDRAGVSINLGVQVDSIVRGSLSIAPIATPEQKRVVPADTVIIAGRVEPDTSLFDALEGRIAERYSVGDCTGLGLIQKAVLDGARAASQI